MSFKKQYTLKLLFYSSKEEYQYLKKKKKVWKYLKHMEIVQAVINKIVTFFYGEVWHNFFVFKNIKISLND